MDDIGGEQMMLTVFLRHDQSQHLEEFQPKLGQRDWWGRFPPEGVEIVSWNVVMGIGQIVTLRLPPSRLQAVNVELERSAWGVFRTETYPSYDFMGVRERLARESKARLANRPDPDGPDEDENRLGDAPEEPFRRGVHDFGEIAAELNELGIAAPGGKPWTEASFGSEMRRRLGGGDL